MLPEPVIQGGKMRKRIYVAGAINATHCDDVFENLRIGSRYSLKVLLDPRLSPFNPFFGFLYRLVAGGIEARRLQAKGVFYDADMAWLEVADAVLVVPDSDESVGVINEIEFAKERGIPIFHSLNELKAWADDNADSNNGR